MRSSDFLDERSRPHFFRQVDEHGMPLVDAGGAPVLERFQLRIDAVVPSDPIQVFVFSTSFVLKL